METVMREFAQFADLKIGDQVWFFCNGRGRGGHYRVHVEVKKINKKTFKAVEMPRSYSPGTEWTVHSSTDLYSLER